MNGLWRILRRITAMPLDLRGLKCPLPALRAQKALRGMQPGETLTVLADDPAAWEEMPLFCEQSGHTLTAKERDEPSGEMRFTLCCRAEVPLR